MSSCYIARAHAIRGLGSDPFRGRFSLSHRAGGRHTATAVERFDPSWTSTVRSSNPRCAAWEPATSTMELDDAQAGNQSTTGWWFQIASGSP
eukprot:Skav219424  [mRNA]  locus=scaffold571:364846:366037:- [translate_table: standard]